MAGIWRGSVPLKKSADPVVKVSRSVRVLTGVAMFTSFQVPLIAEKGSSLFGTLSTFGDIFDFVEVAEKKFVIYFDHTIMSQQIDAGIRWYAVGLGLVVGWYLLRRLIIQRRAKMDWMFVNKMMKTLRPILKANDTKILTIIVETKLNYVDAPVERLVQSLSEEGKIIYQLAEMEDTSDIDSLIKELKWELTRTRVAREFKGKATWILENDQL